MNLITRRDAIRSSGLAALIPLAGRSIKAQGVQGASATANTPPVTYNPDLSLRTYNEVAQMFVKVRRGVAAPNDLYAASAAVRLYARHLDSLQYDKLTNYVANKIDVNRTDYSDLQSVDGAYSTLHSLDGTIAREDFAPAFRLTKDSVARGKASVLKHGLVWHIDVAADVFHAFAKTLSEKEMENSSFAGRGAGLVLAGDPRRTAKTYVPAVYTYGTSPKVERISNWFTTGCQYVACWVIAGYIANDVQSALVAELAGMTANQICEDDAIVSIFTDVTTEAAGLVASPLEVAICAGAQAVFVGGKTVLSSTAVNAIISGAFATIATKFGCPS